MEARGEGSTRMGEGGTSESTQNICIKDVFSFRVADQVMYCRLCATVSNDAVPIFGEQGVRRNLADKINVALPIWVSRNMGPPLHVCWKCIEALDITINFINQVVAAQKKINSVFKVLQDHSKTKVPLARDKDASRSAFITYFRANKFRKLDTINRQGSHEAEKENEGGRHIALPGHTPKNANDSVSSLVTNRVSNAEKSETAKKILEEIFSTETPLAREKSLNSENNSISNHAPVVDLTDDNSNNRFEGDDLAEDFDSPMDDVETHLASTSFDNNEPVVVNENNSAAGNPDYNSKSSSFLYDNVCKYCNQDFRWNTELISHQMSAHEDSVFCCRVCFRVFYDDVEEFTKHVYLHKMKGRLNSMEISNESTPSNPDSSIRSTIENSCVIISENKTLNPDSCVKSTKEDSCVIISENKTLNPHSSIKSTIDDSCVIISENKTPNPDSSIKSTIDDSCVIISENKTPKVHLNYICKYCSKKYSKLNELFSHQTESHSDLVFRCNYCSKVFYENEEELHKHEECHGVSRTKYKHRGCGADNSNDDGLYLYHTEEQQEWIKKILAGRREKIPDQNSKAVGKRKNRNTPSANTNAENSDISPSVNINTASSSPANMGALSNPLEMKISFQNMTATPAVQNRLTSPNGSTAPKKSTTPNRLTTPFTLVHYRVKNYNCKACQIVFKSEEERELHRLFHHKLKLPCRFCPRTLAGKKKLLDHEASHLKKPKLLCRKCGQEFENLEELTKHKRTPCVVQQLPRFSCQICKRLYIRESELKIHLETHLDERPFLCEKCGQCFKDVPSLREHRSNPCKTKGFTRGYNCEICEKNFSNARLLASHRLHTHKAVYPCPLCGLVFRSRLTMTSHMKNHSEILCLVCNEAFESLDHLQNHRKKEHPEEDMTEFSAFEDDADGTSVPKLKCNECDKCFATERTLSIHEATHSNELTWKCRLCDENFLSETLLKSHMSSHPGEHPHKCGICDKTFSLHKNLIQHEKLHFQEESHVCEKCGKSFSTTAELSKHYAEHTSYNAFTCPFCPMSFSRKISLLIHQRTHLTRVYSCSVCNEKFSQLKLVQEHEKTHGKKVEDPPAAAQGMDEDALAASLLDMSEAVAGVSNADHILEEVVISDNISSDSGKRECIPSNIMLDPEYAEVVYVSHSLDDIL